MNDSLFEAIIYNYTKIYTYLLVKTNKKNPIFGKLRSHHLTISHGRSAELYNFLSRENLLKIMTKNEELINLLQLS